MFGSFGLPQGGTKELRVAVLSDCRMRIAGFMLEVDMTSSFTVGDVGRGSTAHVHACFGSTKSAMSRLPCEEALNQENAPSPRDQTPLRDTNCSPIRDNPAMDVSSISLDRLKAFLAVVEAGGFTAAAQRLKLGKNALSQQVAKLEKDLGMSLFTRTTRMVVPTEAGRRLHQACLPLLSELQTTLEALGETRLTGSLRVTAPADYADTVLCAALADFGRLHPQLHIELVTDSKILDLVAERIDLGVRLGWPRDSSLRAVQVGDFELSIVTSAGYIARAGTPQHPRDLADHSWVALSALPNPSSWRFSDEQGHSVSVRMNPCFSANTVEGVLALARAGAGITVATDFSTAKSLEQGTLLRLLPEWRLPRAGIYLTWPSASQESTKVRALVDFLRQRLG